jgi:hypothetical protein
MTEEIMDSSDNFNQELYNIKELTTQIQKHGLWN